ncbi:hypothetical protein DFH09DRAFT_1490994 [Mycena vulgaris]|nr:hypothetical protein DFH09DRAFT_1490994 [Mycena vulgaris]
MSFSTTAASRAETCICHLRAPNPSPSRSPASWLPGPQHALNLFWTQEARVLPRDGPPSSPYAAARAAQRLPPLFFPTPFSALGGPASTAATPFGAPVVNTSATAITEPARLPVAQAFTARSTRPSPASPRRRTPPPGTPLFPFVTAISCRSEFAGHSVEELFSAQIFSGLTAPPLLFPPTRFTPIPLRSAPPAAIAVRAPAPVSTPLFPLGSVAARPIAAQTFSFDGAQPQPPAPGPGVFGQPPGSMFGQPAQASSAHRTHPRPRPRRACSGSHKRLASSGKSHNCDHHHGAAGGGGGTGFSFGGRRGL